MNFKKEKLIFQAISDHHQRVVSFDLFLVGEKQRLEHFFRDL